MKINKRAIVRIGNIVLRDIVRIGNIVFPTLFFVFCGLSIINSFHGLEMSKLGIESIAPENLKRSTESFQLSLKVENHDFPVDEMMTTQAWADLNKRLSAYTERLQLFEKRKMQRELLTSLIYLLSAIGMFLFLLLSPLLSLKTKPWQKSPGLCDMIKQLEEIEKAESDEEMARLLDKFVEIKNKPSS